AASRKSAGAPARARRRLRSRVARSKSVAGPGMGALWGGRRARSKHEGDGRDGIARYAGAMWAENDMRASRAVRLMAAARGAYAGLADLALPPHCLACDRRVADEGGLCPACWAGLRLIERPYCERLGVPFAYDAGAGALSPEAIAEP